MKFNPRENHKAYNGAKICVPIIRFGAKCHPINYIGSNTIYAERLTDHIITTVVSNNAPKTRLLDNNVHRKITPVYRN